MVIQSQTDSPENIYTSTIIQTEQDEYRCVYMCVSVCVNVTTLMKKAIYLKKTRRHLWEGLEG